MCTCVIAHLYCWQNIWTIKWISVKLQKVNIGRTVHLQTNMAPLTWVAMWCLIHFHSPTHHTRRCIRCSSFQHWTKNLFSPVDDFILKLGRTRQVKLNSCPLMELFLFFCHQAAEMALRLASVNRWCVSGTPVQRGLEGIIYLSKNSFSELPKTADW